MRRGEFRLKGYLDRFLIRKASALPPPPDMRGDTISLSNMDRKGKPGSMFESEIE